ncbi:MAG: hypothetical protein HY810_02100 [Candidatus Omnitrophica bacterium]|nr:hypothetical protein [Candidatus Omnitrophota bacterium]
MYVKGSGNQWDEVPPGTQGGFWVDRGYLGRLGQNDRYPDIPNGQQNALIARIDEKNSSYRSVFNVDDSSYPASQTYSWSWPATNETVTSGAMANKVRLSSKSALPAAEQVQKYNCLMASSRLLDGDHMNSGSVLENWHYHEGNNSITKNRVMKGSYFVLDNATDGGFSAANNEFVDYINNPGFYYSNRFRTVSGNNYYGSTFLHTYSNTASLKVSYDENFKTRTRAPSDVFFGGAEALWSEESVDYFYKLTGF